MNTPDHGRFVAINDLHYGVDSEGNNIHLPIGSILRFIRYYLPNVLILNGDIMDFACVSHWNKDNKLAQKQQPLLKDYYDSFQNDILNPIRTAAGSECAIIYILGNHEDFINRLIQEFPNGVGYFEVENNVKEVDVFIPYRMDRFFKFGDIHFLHGYTTTMHHAKKVAQDYMRNVRYGHSHTIQSHTITTAIDNKPIMAQSCGCWCRRGADYMKNRPNTWQNAILYGEVLKDGTSFDSLIKTTNSSLLVAGRVF